MAKEEKKVVAHVTNNVSVVEDPGVNDLVSDELPSLND